MNEYIYERREGKREEKSVYRDAEVNMISLICMWGGGDFGLRIFSYLSTRLSRAGARH